MAPERRQAHGEGMGSAQGGPAGRPTIVSGRRSVVVEHIHTQAECVHDALRAAPVRTPASCHTRRSAAPSSHVQSSSLRITNRARIAHRARTPTLASRTCWRLGCPGPGSPSRGLGGAGRMRWPRREACVLPCHGPGEPTGLVPCPRGNFRSGGRWRLRCQLGWGVWSLAKVKARCPMACGVRRRCV